MLFCINCCHDCFFFSYLVKQFHSRFITTCLNMSHSLLTHHQNFLGEVSQITPPMFTHVNMHVCDMQSWFICCVENPPSDQASDGQRHHTLNCCCVIPHLLSPYHSFIQLLMETANSLGYPPPPLLVLFYSGSPHEVRTNLS